MQGLIYFFDAIVEIFTPRMIFDALWSTQLGIIIGMLPGLTATMGVALLATLTFGMSTNSAVLILLCMYVGAIYGGSRTAILLNIPGTPANAATAVDGFPLAKKGLAGRAIGIATTGSFLGTAIGAFFLAFFTPMLGEFALEFQSFEFVWLAIFGIVVCGNLTAPKEPLKGWIAGFVGLFIAMIGMDGIHAYIRFSFNSVGLSGGINLIAAMVGAFGLSEILVIMSQRDAEMANSKIERVIPKVKEVARYWKTIIRSGIVGTFIGALPGVGEDISAWVSYDLAKRSSKNKDEFGKGSLEGLIAAETGNNACIAGAMIPVLALGIPGSAPAAVILAAMYIHGIRPGPLIMFEFPTFIYEVVAMVLLASLCMLVLGLSMVKPLLRVLTVPKTKLSPIVFVLCVVGSFAIQSRVFDVWVMFAFGILGFLMRKGGFPIAPLLLGMILGGILDVNLRRALTLCNGNLLAFFQRPICIVLVFCIVLIIILRMPFIKKLKRKKNSGGGTDAAI